MNKELLAKGNFLDNKIAKLENYKTKLKDGKIAIFTDETQTILPISIESINMEIKKAAIVEIDRLLYYYKKDFKNL